jgi:predicted TPR repeat methyltransferase
MELDDRQALHVAVELHRRGHHDVAEPVYRSVLELNPGDANATHFLGLLQVQRGRLEEGTALMRRSLQLDPGVASWHNNLGNALLEARDLDGATDAYARCHALDPANAEVLNNLGVLRRGQQQLALAETAFLQAIERRPDFADAHSNLALLYYQQQRIDEGHAHSAEALRLQPAHRGARRVLGVLYAQMGRLDEACRVFREWLAHEPGNLLAQHHLAACGGGVVPERASDGFVEAEFDGFAASFDAKLAQLDYHAPALVGGAVARLLGAPDPRARIVDVGCGTGLCGPFLVPYARQLVGVDLSANMLQRARERGGYDELVKAELVAFLGGQPARFELAVSADTLCYFGPLEAPFAALRRALVPGGHLVFTDERHDDEHAAGHHLHPHGRYSHRRDYLQRALTEAGFEPLDFEPVTLRHESGKPVAGWLATARAMKSTAP